MPFCMNIFLHSPLNSCNHISPVQCKLLRPMEGLFTQETTCILCSISSHIFLNLATPAELYCLCSKCDQLGRELIYSVAARHLVLVKLFPLSYFLAEQLFLGLIDRFQVACFVIDNYTKALQKFEVFTFNSEWSMWIISHVEKCTGYLWE